MSKNIAIIFAGGSGARMGSGLPKQFIDVQGKPIIIHTLECFDDHNEIDEIFISCKAGFIDRLNKLIKKHYIATVSAVVEGGDTAMESAYNVLIKAAETCSDNDIVLIHDGVRPFITDDLISENIRTVKEKGNAVTCTPMYETPVMCREHTSVDEVLERDVLYTAQAPQSFYLGEILDAHKKTRKANPKYKGIVDACTLMKNNGKNVNIVEGNRGNIKITTPEDLYLFQGLIQYREARQAYGLTEKELPEALKNY